MSRASSITLGVAAAASVAVSGIDFVTAAVIG